MCTMDSTSHLLHVLVIATHVVHRTWRRRSRSSLACHLTQSRCRRHRCVGALGLLREFVPYSLRLATYEHVCFPVMISGLCCLQDDSKKNMEDDQHEDADELGKEFDDEEQERKDVVQRERRTMEKVSQAADSARAKAKQEEEVADHLEAIQKHMQSLSPLN